MTENPQSGAEAFGSVHTGGYAPLLRELGCTLLATTFQAGRLIFIRPQGATLNTHFHALSRPMGLAADIERIFVGGQRGVYEFRNVPAVRASCRRRMSTTRSICCATCTLPGTSTSTRWHSPAANAGT